MLGAMLLLLPLLAVLGPLSAPQNDAEREAACLCAMVEADICNAQAGTCVCIDDDGWTAFLVGSAEGDQCDAPDAIAIEGASLR